MLASPSLDFSNGSSNIWLKLFRSVRFLAWPLLSVTSNILGVASTKAKSIVIFWRRSVGDLTPDGSKQLSGTHQWPNVAVRLSLIFSRCKTMCVLSLFTEMPRWLANNSENCDSTQINTKYNSDIDKIQWRRKYGRWSSNQLTVMIVRFCVASIEIINWNADIKNEKT